MTAAEAMRDVAMWVAPGASHYGKLGAIAYVEGQWQLHDQPIPQEDARRYLIGFLQEWFVKTDRERPCAISMYDPALCAHNHEGFLGALWTTYKAVEKIEVG